MRLYILAMEEEAKDIIVNYEMVFNKPFLLYKNDNNLLAISNIGKVNSAFVLTTIINKYDVDEIINIGFVGASNEFEIGDNILVEKAIYHDFDLTIFGYELGQVPNLDFPFDTNNDIFNKTSKHFNKAVLYTGDKFMSNNFNHPFIVDMEAAAFFQVANIMNIPIISVKVVSDIIGNEIKEYEEFEKTGSKNILDLYLKIENILNN